MSPFDRCCCSLGVAVECRHGERPFKFLPLILCFRYSSPAISGFVVNVASRDGLAVPIVVLVMLAWALLCAIAAASKVAFVVAHFEAWWRLHVVHTLLVRAPPKLMLGTG